MKTEQIEVPHFEGFECIGLAIPDRNEHYVLSPDGSSLIQMNGYCMQPCYKKIPLKTMTLMYIPKGIAQEGDYIELSNPDGFYEVHGLIGHTCTNLWRPI